LLQRPNLIAESFPELQSRHYRTIAIAYAALTVALGH
jgi:hypothetical protein